MTEKDKEDLESLEATLMALSSIWYDDPNGPCGFECPDCYASSKDGKSPPPHSADCDIIRGIGTVRRLLECM